MKHELIFEEEKVCNTIIFRGYIQHNFIGHIAYNYSEKEWTFLKQKIISLTEKNIYTSYV